MLIPRRIAGTALLLAAVAGVSQGCHERIRSACPATADAAASASVTDVEKAALAWRMGDAKHWDDTGPIFITSRGDEEPSADLLRRLRERYPELAGRFTSASPTYDEDGRAQDRVTGERGVTLYTSTLAFRGASEATVLVGRGGCGNLCGDATTVLVRCTAGSWRVEPGRRTLVF